MLEGLLVWAKSRGKGVSDIRFLVLLRTESPIDEGAYGAQKTTLYIPKLAPFFLPNSISRTMDPLPAPPPPLYPLRLSATTAH